jgi:hypothetical protein
MTALLPAAIAALTVIPWTDPGHDRNRLSLDQSEAAFIDRGDDPDVIHDLFNVARAGQCRSSYVRRGETFGQMLFGNGRMLTNVRADTDEWPVTTAALRCAADGYELVEPICANWSISGRPPLPPIPLPPYGPEIGPGSSPGWIGGTFGANNEGEFFNAAPSFFLPAPAVVPPPQIVLVTLPPPPAPPSPEIPQIVPPTVLPAPSSPPSPEIPEVVPPLPGAPTPPATGPPGAPIPEPWSFTVLATFLAGFAIARRLLKVFR